MSRYPKPGSVIDAWWEDGRPPMSHHGPAVVLATSRHKAVMSLPVAHAILGEEWADEVDRHEVIGVYEQTWRSVTRWDYEEGDSIGDASEVGSFDLNATGSAWIRVALPLLREPAPKPTVCVAHGCSVMVCAIAGRACQPRGSRRAT